jgi:hypothetical protein
MSIGISAATLLFLPAAAATTCPPDWTPSPTHAAWGPRCYLVPPERSTSLSRCVELCEEHGGAPACIGSAEENRHVTAGLAATEGLWLGLYQNETGLGPAKGWSRCVAGDAPSFTNWRRGQPHDYHGYQQDCAWVDAGTGQWRALACDGGVRFDPLPWRIAELSCLCAHGSAASAAFADDRQALEVTSGYNQRLLTRRTAISFSIAAALALLPTLLLLGRTGWCRLRAATLPSQSATRATLTTPSGTASSTEAKTKLRAARASAAGRRLRVSFAMVQAGWALSIIGGTPAIQVVMGQSIAAAVGDRNWWILLVTLGGCLLGLALFPTDARAIRVVCATLFAVGAGIGALKTSSQHSLETGQLHLPSRLLP